MWSTGCGSSSSEAPPPPDAAAETAIADAASPADAPEVSDAAYSEGWPCKHYTCAAATAGGSCGWCTDDNRSYPGSPKGPDSFYGACSASGWRWTPDQCP